MKRLDPKKWREQVRTLKRLGSGAYGTVYAIGNRAVKISPTEKEARVCRLMAGKRLPGVVRIHSVQDLPDKYGNVRQWAIYQERLRPHPSMSFNEMDNAIRGYKDDRNPRWVKAVQRGKDSLASLGLEHTDIHGANVLFGPDGGLRIIDFGLVYSTKGRRIPGRRYVEPPPARVDGCMCSICVAERNHVARKEQADKRAAERVAGKRAMQPFLAKDLNAALLAQKPKPAAITPEFRTALETRWMELVRERDKNLRAWIPADGNGGKDAPK